MNSRAVLVAAAFLAVAAVGRAQCVGGVCYPPQFAGYYSQSPFVSIASRPAPLQPAGLVASRWDVGGVLTPALGPGGISASFPPLAPYAAPSYGPIVEVPPLEPWEGVGLSVSAYAGPAVYAPSYSWSAPPQLGGYYYAQPVVEVRRRPGRLRIIVR